MNLTATLVIGARDWLVPAAGALGVVLVLLVWGYRHAAATSRVRITAGLLKAMGIAALAACLIEPLWSVARFRPGANLFVILADNSQSLRVKDRDAEQTRGQQFHALLTDDLAGWRVRLGQDFDVRSYLFDARLQRTVDFSELKFDGQASALGSALRTVKERYKGRPLAGVLLLTDGNATDLADASTDLEGLAPVYPVILGEGEPADDVGITATTVSQTSFEDAPVAIQVEVTTSGLREGTIVGELIDERGQTVARKTEPVSPDGRPVSLRFQIRPVRSGPSFYHVKVTAVRAGEDADSGDPMPEATLANNDRLVVVDRGTGPYPVLYVSGRPNWEFKFLNRALADDDQIDLVGLIRIARREPKFDWRGRAGESSNPLFRGFKEGDVEEAERYDEPVLIRLNVSDEKELQDGFPKTAETLFRYHALILDDVESEFFTHDQMALIRRFVSERGGGFLMLGGFASYRHGQYQRTPIADLLPVYLHAASGDVQPQPPLRIKLSREGWLAPWVRLRDNEMDEQKRLKDMPHFSIFSGLRSVKPGASVLSRVEDANGNEHPALVVQRFGRGRCGAMLIGDLWRWGLRKKEGDDDLAKAWRQTVRWLIADVPARLGVEIEERRDEPNAPVRLRVRVRDREYQALENASVRLTIRPPDGASISLEGEPSLEQAGVYEVEYVPRQPGAYRATINVTDPSGVPVGRIEAGWTSNPAAEEFRSLRTDRQRLESFAGATGGQLVPVDELEAFVRSLSTRTLPVTERSMVPLWHRPAVFLFAIACLILEWGLRRFRGLP